MDRYVETKLSVSIGSPFYYPQRNFNVNYIGLMRYRPYCDCTGMLDHRSGAMLPYQQQRCVKCKVNFVGKDSVWICKRAKKCLFNNHHKHKKFYICQICALNRINENPKARNLILKYKENIKNGFNVNSINNNNNSNDDSKINNILEDFDETCNMPILSYEPLNIISMKNCPEYGEFICDNKELIRILNPFYHSVLYIIFNQMEYIKLANIYLNDRLCPMPDGETNEKKYNIDPPYQSLNENIIDTIDNYLDKRDLKSVFYILKAWHLRHNYLMHVYKSRPKDNNIKQPNIDSWDSFINYNHIVPPLFVEQIDMTNIKTEYSNNNDVITIKTENVIYQKPRLLNAIPEAIISDSDNDINNDNEREMSTIVLENKDDIEPLIETNNNDSMPVLDIDVDKTKHCEMKIIEEIQISKPNNDKEGSITNDPDFDIDAEYKKNKIGDNKH